MRERAHQADQRDSIGSVVRCGYRKVTPRIFQSAQIANWRGYNATSVPRTHKSPASVRTFGDCQSCDHDTVYKDLLSNTSLFFWWCFWGGGEAPETFGLLRHDTTYLHGPKMIFYISRTPDNLIVVISPPYARLPIV